MNIPLVTLFNTNTHTDTQKDIGKLNVYKLRSTFLNISIKIQNIGLLKYVM